MKKFTLILLLTASLLAAGCTKKADEPSQDSTKEPTASSAAAKNNQTSVSEELDPTLLSNSQEFGKIAENTGADKAKIVNNKEYNVKLVDNTWAGVTVTIDRATILKLDEYQDKDGHQYEGYAVLHYQIESPEHTIKIQPEKGTLTTNTQQQSAGNFQMDNFAGEIKKGQKVSGNAAYPIAKLQHAGDVASLDLKFSAENLDAKTADEEKNHEYHLILDKIN